MIALTCTSRLAANSTEPNSAAAVAFASDPPSASQVTGPITSDRVPNPPYSTANAIRAQFLPLAQPCGQVHQSGEGEQSDGDAADHLGRRADLLGRGVDDDQGGLEHARGDRDEPEPEGGAELPRRPGRDVVKVQFFGWALLRRLGAVMPSTFRYWDRCHHPAIGPIRHRDIPNGSRRRSWFPGAALGRSGHLLHKIQPQCSSDHVRLAVGLC
jgi:hypothetical protein